MNDYILLTATEWEALEGLPHFVICLYLALKRHCDFRTGIVGQTKRISWRTLCSELYVEEHQGFDESGSPTRQRVERAMQWLKKRELVQDLGSKKRGEPIVFKLLLAHTPSSVHNKPVQNPCRTRAGYPEQDEIVENPKKSNGGERPQQKAVQNPCSEKSENPYDINSQYSVLPTDINNLPNTSPVQNTHTSSSELKPALNAQALELFAEWQKIMGKPRAALDRKRKARIEWALKTYGYDTCVMAIEGCARSEWHMGKNDRGQRYDDLTLIFRDAEKVERFLEYRNQQPQAQHRSSTLDRWMGTDAIEGEVITARAIGG